MIFIKALKKYGFSLAIGTACFIIGLNIISSQQISPLYIGLINGDETSLVSFLKKTLSLPQSAKWIRSAKKKYGQKKIEKEVFSKREIILARIKKLEQILKKNPNARDILYGLSISYRQLGKDDRAKTYLRRAQKIDPQVDQQELVKFTK